MATYRVTNSAIADLDNIWDYLEGLASDNVATRQLDQLRIRFELLSDNRFLGRPRTEYNPDLRSYAVPNLPYVIFYLPRDFGVEIVRVLHGSRRLTSLLEQ